MRPVVVMLAIGSFAGGCSPVAKLQLPPDAVIRSDYDGPGSESFMTNLYVAGDKAFLTIEKFEDSEPGREIVALEPIAPPAKDSIFLSSTDCQLDGQPAVGFELLVETLQSDDQSVSWAETLRVWRVDFEQVTIRPFEDAGTRVRCYNIANVMP